MVAPKETRRGALVRCTCVIYRGRKIFLCLAFSLSFSLWYSIVGARGKTSLSRQRAALPRRPLRSLRTLFRHFLCVPFTLFLLSSSSSCSPRSSKPFFTPRALFSDRSDARQPEALGFYSFCSILFFAYFIRGERDERKERDSRGREI